MDRAVGMRGGGRFARLAVPAGGPRNAPLAGPPRLWLRPKAGGRGDHRRPAVVDRVDDLARIYPLEVDRRDPEVGMSELSLDDR